jgi:hypothetical protein
MGPKRPKQECERATADDVGCWLDLYPTRSRVSVSPDRWSWHGGYVGAHGVPNRAARSLATPYQILI